MQKLNEIATATLYVVFYGAIYLLVLNSVYAVIDKNKNHKENE